jgi:hypothetical protein
MFGIGGKVKTSTQNPDRSADGFRRVIEAKYPPTVPALYVIDVKHEQKRAGQSRRAA